MSDTTSEDARTASPVTDPQVHAGRAALYAAAATAFQYPTESVVADLTDEAAAAGLREAAERLGFAEEVDALLSAFESTDSEVLRSMHQGLFDLPEDDGTYRVVPYEAAYTAGEEIDKQQRRIATVVGLMERFGVEPREEFTERQDHVAAELELCQVVAAQRAVALREDGGDTAKRLRNAESTILGEHLHDFVPPLAKRLRSSTDSDAYRAAADLAEALVTWDHARHPAVSVTPSDLSGPAGVSPDE